MAFVEVDEPGAAGPGRPRRFRGAGRRSSTRAVAPRASFSCSAVVSTTQPVAVDVPQLGQLGVDAGGLPGADEAGVEVAEAHAGPTAGPLDAVPQRGDGRRRRRLVVHPTDDGAQLGPLVEVEAPAVLRGVVAETGRDQRQHPVALGPVVARPGGQRGDDAGVGAEGGGEREAEPAVAPGRLHGPAVAGAVADLPDGGVRVEPADDQQLVDDVEPPCAEGRRRRGRRGDGCGDGIVG